MSAILELCLSPDLGGLELYMYNSALLLSETNRVISVVDKTSKLENYFSKTSLHVSYLPKRSKLYLLSCAKKLAKIIDEENIEVMHVHWTKDLPLAVLAKRLSQKKPQLVQSRHMHMTRFKDDIYHRFLYKNIDLILAVTKEVKGEIERFIPERVRPRVDVLYLGAKEQMSISAHEIERCKAEYKMDKSFIVGMIGRISETKGQYLLIEALAKVNSEDIAIYFAGHEMKKGYSDSLKQLAQKLGVSQRVHFLGFLDSPQLFYSLCDTIVLASKNETFGLVLIEAMQAKKAVIGSKSGGVVEIIEDKISGLLFEPLDAQDLANKISLLYEDNALREQIQLAGKRRAHEKFSQKKHFKALATLFNAISSVSP